MRILLSAGEVSGDVAGSRLVRALRERRSGLAFFGLGGPRMAEAGVELLRSTNALGTVGISESFRVVPGLVRAFASLRRRVVVSPPGAAVLIANDVFHVLLGRWLRARGVPTLSYFPPQVWIWRSLARVFAPSFDEILTSFPDEERVWRAAGASTTFVGHYLGDVLRPATEEERRSAREALGLPAGPLVAVLPGSRELEVRRLTPVLLDAARLLHERDGRIRFVLPVADSAFAPRIEAEVARRGLEGVLGTTSSGHVALRAADLAILASGTASLEAALIGTPMVIAYRLAALTMGVVRSAISLGLIDSDTVGLPNLVLGRRAIPEHIQDRASGLALSAAAARLLGDESLLEEQRQALGEVSRLLFAGGSDARAAEAVLAAAERRSVRGAAFGGAIVREEGSGT
ncbi:MAG TPA: lipid-A-disaccharide synthase [Thermoanaerobaculia bacterium]|nr:lipid-A-disaccharide synthase [Thermoanaerobaculia bacterium]